MLDEPLDIDYLMKYTLSPVPHALGTPDGYFAKINNELMKYTNKASLVHYLLDDEGVVEYPEDAFHIHDGNAMFHDIKNVPPTFQDISLKVLNDMASMPQHFLFSTDTYESTSIKTQERLRCGISDKHIVDGPAT